MPRRNSPKTAEHSKPAAPEQAGPVRLLSGGNPQIPKGDGNSPVQAFIAAMPGWKRAAGQRIDALVTRHWPEAQKAVRWNSPFYGLEGRGWLVSFHVFTSCVKLTFFCGSSLDPAPPGRGKDPAARWVDIRSEDEIDEALIGRWLTQAARFQGWIMKSK